MDKTKAYVGDWSPAIHLPGDGTEAGISQGNEPYNGGAGFLAVERGKKYVGHIVLAGEGVRRKDTRPGERLRPGAFVSRSGVCEFGFARMAMCGAE